jgi:hypothetical protein
MPASRCGSRFYALVCSSIGLCFACVSIPTICSSSEAVHGNPNLKASASSIRGPPDWKDSTDEMVNRHSRVMNVVKNVNGHDIIPIISITCIHCHCHSVRECFLSTTCGVLDHALGTLYWYPSLRSTLALLAVSDWTPWQRAPRRRDICRRKRRLTGEVTTPDCLSELPLFRLAWQDLSVFHAS